MKKDYLDKIKYEKIGETKDSKERQLNWNIAFGLQAVDNLTPSKYMVDLATENIVGKKSYEVVEEQVRKYYENADNEKTDKSERQADEVSVKIVKILNDNAFTFNYLTLKQYHKKLFENIDIGIDEKYIGEFRDYNITKKESILNGESVQYADYSMIEETLKYDFEEEANQRYTEKTEREKLERLCKFTAHIWQIHPFGEGNTRTTALFIQKYLNSKGFDVNNELFKDNSLYFRNALVRANYSNISKGIEEDNKYLIMFFENLLFNKNNKLDNAELKLSNKS